MLNYKTDGDLVLSFKELIIYWGYKPAFLKYNGISAMETLGHDELILKRKDLLITEWGGHCRGRNKM